MTEYRTASEMLDITSDDVRKMREEFPGMYLTQVRDYLIRTRLTEKIEKVADPEIRLILNVLLNYVPR